MKIKRALISVTNKVGLEGLCHHLVQAGVEILASGGTREYLGVCDIPSTEVSDYTGFPEMMGGRLKTLHPLIHGGILGRRSDLDVMAQYNIKQIDLVVCNLYDFESEVGRQSCTVSSAIEQIDIGGPAMLRSAAKNHENVVVLCDPEDYQSFVHTMLRDEITYEYRFLQALKVFKYTSAYDAAIAAFFESESVFL